MKSTLLLPNSRSSVLKRMALQFALTLALALGIGLFSAQAQVTVSGAVSGNGGYSTLGAAITAIGTAQPGANIVIDITGNTTEGTATISIGAGTWASMLIRPQGGAWAITAATTAGSPMIDFNGADNVTIDGLNSSGNALTISNTTVSATSGTSTIRFQTDATGNTITRCSVLGSSTMATTTNGGNIWFGAAAVTTGNDNNTISFCNIGPAGANLPTKGIYGNGSTTTATLYNSGIQIINNNIFDFFNAAAQSNGIYLGAGNDAWTISNNRFYQTATRTQTTGAINCAIQAASTTGNNGHTISGNIIGYSSAAGTGTYNFVGIGTGSKFIGIYFSSAGTTTASSIQGNTITAINLSGIVGGTGTTAAFLGISIGSGIANIGTVTGNTIGSLTTPGAISITSNNASAMESYGIYYFPSAIANVSNNNVGGITMTNSGAGAYTFYGVRAFTSSAVINTMQNNTVGSNTAPISITSSATGTRAVGLYNQSGGQIVSGNSISNISINTANIGTGTTASVIGIWADASSATQTGQVVSLNTVRDLSNANTSAAVWVTGIHTNFNTTVSVTVARNLVYGLDCGSATGTINGIYINGGLATYQNNMVRLGTAGSSATVGMAINGISEIVAGTDNLYHNSVYIGGAPTGGSSNTFAFQSSITTNTRNYVDNIFFNARSNSGSTGKHYAIRAGGTAPAPAGLTCNYNVLRVTGTGGFTGLFNAIDQATIGNWQAATGMDLNSRTEDPQFVNATGAVPDLHINPSVASSAEAQGTLIAAVTDDFDGQTRSGLTPVDIGADAGNFTSLPVCSGTPAAANITGATAVCSGSGTTLGLSTSYTALGITYQWASSATPGGPYTNLGTSASQATGNLTATTYYVCTITCTNSGQSFTTPEYTVTVNPTPTASAGSNSPVCPGSALNLTATTDIGTTFAWSGPNTFTSTQQNPSISSVTGSAAGTYTVTVTSGSCSATASTAVTVSAPVSASATATPASVCNPGSTQLNAVGGTTSAYAVSSTTYGLITPVSPTTLSTLGDDNNVTVAMPFTFNFFGTNYSTAYVHSNGFVSFTSGQPTGSPYTETIPTAATPNNYIALCHDDLNVTGGGTVTHFTSGSTPNRVWVVQFTNVKFYNSAANNGVVSGQIQMFENDSHIEIHLTEINDPTLSVHAAGVENATGTVGYAPPLRNNSDPAWNVPSTSPEAWKFFPSGGTLSYAWSESPASPTTLAATNIANPAASGITVAKTYTVTITETVTGCSNTASVAVTPSAPITAATITPATPAFCTGGSVTLTATPTDGGAPFTYAWAGPGGPAGSAATQVANVGGTWTVTVTDNCGGNVVVSTNVTQNPVPTALAGSNSPVCAGTALNLSVTTDIGTTFAWSGPNSFTSTLQNPVITSVTTAAAGTYNVTVTSAGGCTATSSAIVAVNTAPVISSTTVTPPAVCAGGNSQLQVSVPAPAAYCIPTTTTGCAIDYISNVAIAGITRTSTCDNLSGSNGYSNFVTPTGSLVAGSTGNPYSVSIGGDTEGAAAWVDYNQNGVFEASENIFSGYAGTNPATYSGTFTVPAGAYNGTTRMRVRCMYLTNPTATGACTNNTFGEVEDYTVTITGGVPAYTYAWSPVTYLDNPAIANPLASGVMATTPYTVTVTNGGGCTASSSVTVTANPPVTAGTINGTTPLCLGATATFTTDGTAGGTWSSDNTGVATVDPSSGLVTAVAQGTATITYTVSAGCGSPVSATYNITVNAFDYANLQFPASGTVTQGCIFTAYGQVYEPGLTEAPGPGAGIVAEFGIGLSGTNPNTWTNWTPASFNVQFGNNDEYWFNSNINLPPGAYNYTFRYAYPGCPGAWQYGGFPFGFWDGTTNVSGVLTVNPQPAPPTGLACWQTATFNGTTCQWDVTGTQPAAPTGLACYETATFNTTTCVWDVTGTQPPAPTGLACWQTATFNNTTCAWDVTGTQPPAPTGLACWQTATFNNTTCVWDVTGTQPAAPTGLACYETATFNTSTCVWDVTGTQPPAPTGLACWQTATFNNTTCQWDVTGTQPPAPTGLACWQTATFNNTTCVWDVTGTQPAAPTGLACYETATFNTSTCVWDVTGTQPPAPTGLACWQTATFNNTTCQWDVTGTQPAQPPVVNCWDNFVFNTTTCTWVNTGSQPAPPTGLACWQTATFNTTTCAWDVTGTQPPAPTGLACWETATFNTTTCMWDVTGTQPPAPTGLACWETATFNTTTCVWDVTGTQPVQPTLACYQTATFNNTTCVWDVTGTPPPVPTINTSGTVICAGTTTTLTATGGGTYVWSNGLGTSQSVTVSTAGTYTVTVTNGSCTSTAQISVSTFNCTVTISDPCSCNNNATLAANDGTFNEVASLPFVSSGGSVPADFVVTVLSSTGTTGLPNGTVLTFNSGLQQWETPVFTHVDNIGYSLTVEVLYLPAGTLIGSASISNKCAYPNPVVSGLSASYCTSGSGGTPDTDITALLTGTPAGPAGTFTLTGTGISGGPVTYTFTPPAAAGPVTVSGSYTGGISGNVSPDGGTTPAFPGCIQPFEATTNAVECPPGCNASPIMQWNDN